MESFRNMIKGPIGIGLLVVVAGLFVIGGVATSFTPAGARGEVAIVNGDEIDQYRLERDVQNKRQQMLARMGENANPEWVESLVTKDSVLEEIIQRIVIVQDAEDLGMAIAPAAINTILSETPQFQDANGEFDNTVYQQVLARAGYSPSQYPELLSDDLLLNQSYTATMASAFMSEQDIATVVQLVDQKRDIEYASLKLSQYEEGAEATEEEAQQYYDETPDAFMSQERFSVQYIILDKQVIAATVEVSDESVQQEYDVRVSEAELRSERQVSHILVADNAQEKIAEVQAALDGGDAFADVAKRLSDDSASAEEGGELGWIGRDLLDPELEQAMFALEVGQVSAPIQTEEGTHFITVLSVQAPEIAAFESLSDSIRTSLQLVESQDTFDNQHDELESLAYDSNDLDSPAEALGLTVQAANAVTLGELPVEIAHPSVIDAVQSAELLEDGVNSTVIQLDENRIAVVRVAEHMLPQRKAFDVVQEEVVALVSARKAREALTAAVDTAREQLAEGKSLADVAAELGIEVKSATAIGRRDVNVGPQIVEKAFAMSASTEEQQNVQTVSGSNAGVSFVKVLSIVDGVVEDKSAEELESIRQAYAQSQGQLDFADYTRSRVTDADIEYIRAQQ